MQRRNSRKQLQYARKRGKLKEGDSLEKGTCIGYRGVCNECKEQTKYKRNK